MKVKIREEMKVIAPYYVLEGTFNTPYTGLSIKDKIKYVVLQANILQLPEIEFTLPQFTNFLPVSFYADLKNWADKNISDLYILIAPKRPVQWVSPGFFLNYTEYGEYVRKPEGRLPRWNGPLSYNPPTIFSIINGLTAIPGVDPNTTYNEGGIFSSFNTNYGVLASGSSVETRLTHFKDGITGGKNLIKRPYSFNDINKYNYGVDHPLYTYSGKPTLLASSTPWAQPKNKLLAVLEDIDARQALNIPQYLSMLAVAWRYQREIYQNNSGITPGLKTQEQLNALNVDLLDNLKILLDEYKTHYPLARPQNGVGPSITELWSNPEYRIPAGLCGPGVRQTPFPLGATQDYMAAEGVTYNTWSPGGWTRDQGMYLFDGWGLEHLLFIAYHLTDAPGNVDPVTKQSELLVDPVWGEILNDIRILMTKEIFDCVKHLEEGRPWYSKRKYWDDGTIRDGYQWPSRTYPDGTNWSITKPSYSQMKTGGGYFYPDPDNRGYPTTNQNITPIANRIAAVMYLYKYARNKTERQGLLAAYDMFVEYWAAMLERFMYGTTNRDQCGNWPEGWAYAAQSLPDFLKVLDITRKNGDYRLWETNNTPDYFDTSIKGVPYKSWADNVWRWIVSRIMPNNLIINVGSCNTAGWEAKGNIYQFNPYSIYWQALLLSDDPVRGNTGSAVAELYDWFDIFDTNSPFALEAFSVIKKYKQGPIKNKVTPKGYYTQTERIFVWKSDVVIPKYHSDWLYGTDPSLKNNFSKPLIFAIWGKGVGIHEEKVNQDGGHISAYLGDAVLLHETGELRSLIEGSGTTDAIKKYFHTDTYRAKGHNKMQLGERLDPASPKDISWVNIRFGETGGYAFIDKTPTYNRVGLTGNAYGWVAVPQGEGYLYQTNGEPYTQLRNGDPKFYLAHPSQLTPYTFKIGDNTFYGFEPYQYQIRTCTRGITWSYFNNIAKIEIEDIVGISAMNELFPGAQWYATGPYATGPDTRVYYRFHVGYTGVNAPNVFPLPKEGSDTGLTLFSIVGSNDKEWNVCWKQPIPFNSTLGSQYDYVGITMSFKGNQPIRLEKEMCTNNSFKYSPAAVPGIGAIPPSRHYAINVLLGLSGGVYHDQMNLKLNTTIDAEAVLGT